MFERLGQLAGARLHLLEQPYVLHGDHRLVCERLDQLDLLVGERLYGIARESDHPDRGSLAHQRYAEQRAAADFLRAGELIVRIGLGIDNMHGPTFKQGSAHDAVTPGLEWDVLKHRYELRRHAVVCDRLEEARLVRTGDMPAVRLAQSNSRLHQRLQHCLQIEGRAADDLEHVGGGGLLLQGFAQVARARLYLVEQPHVLDSDDGLVGEGLDQLDLLIGERLYGI